MLCSSADPLIMWPPQGIPVYTFAPMQSLGKPEILKSWKGLTSFELALSQQQTHWKALRPDGFEGAEKIGNEIVLGYEHPLIVTLGRSAVAENEILAPNLVHIRTDRGGLATIHSPGQLLIYPIINLRRHCQSVKSFITLLSQVTVEFFEKQKISVHYNPTDPGFYTANGKIGFLGIRIKEGISYHGISLNIHNDISLFDSIKSCGVTNRQITRLVTSKENRELFSEWAEIFVKRITSEKKRSYSSKK